MIIKNIYNSNVTEKPSLWEISVSILSKSVENFEKHRKQNFPIVSSSLQTIFAVFIEKT